MSVMFWGMLNPCCLGQFILNHLAVVLLMVGIGSLAGILLDRIRCK